MRKGKVAGNCPLIVAGYPRNAGDEITEEEIGTESFDIHCKRGAIHEDGKKLVKVEEDEEPEVSDEPGMLAEIDKKAKKKK